MNLSFKYHNYRQREILHGMRRDATPPPVSKMTNVSPLLNCNPSKSLSIITLSHSRVAACIDNHLHDTTQSVKSVRCVKLCNLSQTDTQKGHQTRENRLRKRTAETELLIKDGLIRGHISHGQFKVIMTHI